MTVFYCYSRWSMCTGGQCGAKWHGDPSIGDAIELVPLVLEVLLKDALGLNECIVAETQRRLDASYSAEKVRLLFDLTCLGHKTARCHAGKHIHRFRDGGQFLRGWCIF